MCQVDGHFNLPLPTVLLLSLSEASLPVAAPKIWNALPDNVVSASSIDSFQHQLKAFLFRSAVRALVDLVAV